MTLALEARDVSLRFGGLQALDSVEIEVGEWEIVGLIGPNGAGKTTLFDVLTQPVGDLAYGTQKLCDLAMALGTDPTLLLLDEPSSGMGSEEARRLGEVLTFMRSELNLTILMIEHHVPLVVEVCDFVYVLNFGRLVTRGEPGDVQAHPDVVAAYLGQEAEDATA